MLLSLLSASLLASRVLASEFRGAGQAEVKAGEIVNDDLYIAGNSVNIAGTVNGDVVAAGNSVTVSGRINGNLFALAQTVTVSGRVEGGVFAAAQTLFLSGQVVPSARVAAQTIIVQGQIGRDLLAAGQSVTLDSEGAVGQDVLLGAQEANLRGDIGRKVSGNAGSLVIAGKAGDVDVAADQLTLMPGASIGSLTYTSAQEARIESGAAVSGDINRLEPAKPETAQRRASSWTDQIAPRLLWFIAALIAGFVLSWIAPALVQRPALALRDKPWPSLGWGAILFVVTPIAVLIALITVVGIPIGLLFLFAYVAALFLSQIFVGLLIGQLVLQQKPTEGTVAMLGPLALGLLLLSIIFALVGLIPVVGGLASLAITVFGLGGAWIAGGRERFGKALEGGTA
ncbi:MAG: polymer-forming cytoskeletal protein [Dehalococcoidia bacterium]|nr:polymer-forming cytoskeletal protein [Dehalococcoidia bacterium]